MSIVSLNLINVQRLSSGKLEFTTQLPADTGDMSCLISHAVLTIDKNNDNHHHLHYFYSQELQMHCSDLLQELLGR